MNVNDMIKRRYKDIIAVCSILLFTLLLLMYFYGVHHMDLRIPFGYDGTDTMSSLVNAKLLSEDWWNVSTSRLAAPFTYYNYDNLIAGMHNCDLVLMKLFVTITGSPAMAVNLTFLLIFPLTGLISYGVFRSLKVKEWVAAAGSLTFAFLPFIFFRGVEHMVLSEYYFVPLSVLLCIWLYEDENFFNIGKGFFSYKRNIFALIMMFLIANNGIAYYQFFTCFFLIVAGLSSFVKTKKFVYLKKAFASVAGVCIFLIISCLPAIISIAKFGSTTSQYVRSIPDAEFYCLKIIQMLMPVRGHGISYLENIINEYNNYAPLVTENRSAYLGLAGVLGFFILLVFLFTRKDKDDKPYYKRVGYLSELNICAILFGTLGGFGTIFFVFVSQTIRGYNRISVFIAFFCIAAVCLIANELSLKIKKRYYATAFAVGISALALFGIWEQNPKIGIPYESNKAAFESDRDFVHSIEDTMPEGAMIYQLPYQKYPEGGRQGNMNDYELFVGYIHSETLKWSYATSYGNEADIWNKGIAELSTSDMVKTLKEQGFSGIYINRKAYEIAELVNLEKELQTLCGSTAMVSSDGTLSFFEFK